MNKVDYEFPFSPPAETEASLASSKHSLTPEPHNMASIPTPSTVNSTSPSLRDTIEKARRDRTPPKDSAGHLVCDHQECQQQPPTFRRPCEWHKHMDRHERPYKCQQPGCETSPGFTYSGGLMRHQREVHKLHVPNKAPLYCSFPGCNRSTGDGFTRKENLEEHKRRRHSAVPPDADISTQSRKRKRLMTPQPDGVELSDDVDGEQDDNLNNRSSPYVQRLHAELAQKDAFIQAQATEIHRLTNILRSIPPQTIYHSNHNLMSPPASVQRQTGQIIQRTASSGMV